MSISPLSAFHGSSGSFRYGKTLRSKLSWSVRSRIGLSRQLRRLGKMSLGNGNVRPVNRELRLVGGSHDQVVVIDKPVLRLDGAYCEDRGWPYDNPLPIGLDRLPVRPDKSILPTERAELGVSRPIESDSLGQRLDVYA